jgi:hypothetical protein
MSSRTLLSDHVHYNLMVQTRQIESRQLNTIVLKHENKGRKVPRATGQYPEVINSKNKLLVPGWSTGCMGKWNMFSIFFCKFSLHQIGFIYTSCFIEKDQRICSPVGVLSWFSSDFFYNTRRVHLII